MSGIEIGSGNVYADLGVPNAADMLVKAQLASKIGEIIRLRKLTQARAAELLGIPQPKLSNMLRGRFRGISETKMIDYLVRLGQDVDIVVRERVAAKTHGHVPGALHARVRVVFELDEKIVKRAAQTVAPYRARRASAK